MSESARFQVQLIHRGALWGEASVVITDKWPELFDGLPPAIRFAKQEHMKGDPADEARVVDVTDNSIAWSSDR